jgi:predicted PurR-regulated permease PerM
MQAAVATVVTGIIIGTLYVGREVFVPIAMAVLLSFVLAPLVGLLERWRCPRPISVLGVVLIAFVSLFSLGGVIATQMAELAGDLPRYQLTMQEKIKSLRGAAGPAARSNAPLMSFRTSARSSTSRRSPSSLHRLRFSPFRRARPSRYRSRFASRRPPRWRILRR